MLNHFDCFSGPGGFCTGFKAAGFTTLAAVEYVSSTAETYKANHPNVTMLNKDIRNVTESDLDPFVGKINIVSSGMPCETFSTAGSKSRSSFDHRQQLYLEGLKIAKYLKSPFILFENVPGILSKRISKDSPELVIDQIRKDLVAFGYKYKREAILNASDFGVPQERERFFLLASTEDFDYSFPTSTKKTVTVRQAFAALPRIEANEKIDVYDYYGKNSAYSKLMRDYKFWKLPQSDKLTFHNSPNHRDVTIERFSLLEPGESLVDLFKKSRPNKIKSLQNRHVLPKKWFIQRNKRIELDKPSKTVTSHCLDEFVHPEINRALSVREVARLQSFPDSYQFVGGPYICPHIHFTQDKYEQIGDAVPPLLSYNIGISLKKMLEGKNG